jgi:hypothetical protein
MPLGYVLKVGEVLAYYGQERKDVAKAIYRYGRDRRVIMTTEPGTLGGTKGQDGFRNPDEILDLARQAMKGSDNAAPKKYPGFHGTLGKHSIERGIFMKAQKGADVIIDIDVKGDYKAAFDEGRKVLEFLDFYNAPYRVKFSGGSGPHIIIPYEAFPKSQSSRSAYRAHQVLFRFISSRSGAKHIDSSSSSTSHFHRIPYSLNEDTGLVSLPLKRDQYDDFTLSMAEVPNVEVDEDWFQEPDEEAKEALAEMILDAKGKSKRMGIIRKRSMEDDTEEQIRAMDRQLILEALDQENWDLLKAAERLEISVHDLNDMILSHRVALPEDKDNDE